MSPRKYETNDVVVSNADPPRTENPEDREYPCFAVSSAESHPDTPRKSIRCYSSSFTHFQAVLSDTPRRFATSR